MPKLEQLIEKCKQGDMLAAEMIYRQFAAKMFAVCLRYSSSQVDAEDTLQDGFIKIFEQIKSFKAHGSFEGWLRRIFVHLAIEKYRTKNSQIQFVDDYDWESIEEEEKLEDTPISMEKLQNFVQELPDRYRMVFSLYIQENLTHKEIGDILKITEGTSKSNLARAKDILKKRINTYLYERSRV